MNRLTTLIIAALFAALTACPGDEGGKGATVPPFGGSTYTFSGPDGSANPDGSGTGLDTNVPGTVAGGGVAGGGGTGGPDVNVNVPPVGLTLQQCSDAKKVGEPMPAGCEALIAEAASAAAKAMSDAMKAAGDVAKAMNDSMKAAGDAVKNAMSGFKMPGFGGWGSGSGTGGTIVPTPDLNTKTPVDVGGGFQQNPAITAGTGLPSIGTPIISDSAVPPGCKAVDGSSVSYVDISPAFESSAIYFEMIKKLNKKEGEPISAKEAFTITDLRFNNYGMNSLKGIQCIKNLEVLDLSGNLISDLTPLKYLTQLKYLYLNDNAALKDLTPLQTMTSLKGGFVDASKIGAPVQFCQVQSIGALCTEAERAALKDACKVVYSRMVPCDTDIIKGFRLTVRGAKSQDELDYEKAKQLYYANCMKTNKNDSSKCIIFFGPLNNHPLPTYEIKMTGVNQYNGSQTYKCKAPEYSLNLGSPTECTPADNEAAEAKFSVVKNTAVLLEAYELMHNLGVKVEVRVGDKGEYVIPFYENPCTGYKYDASNGYHWRLDPEEVAYCTRFEPQYLGGNCDYNVFWTEFPLSSGEKTLNDNIVIKSSGSGGVGCYYNKGINVFANSVSWADVIKKANSPNEMATPVLNMGMSSPWKFVKFNVWVFRPGSESFIYDNKCYSYSPTPLPYTVPKCKSFDQVGCKEPGVSISAEFKEDPNACAEFKKLKLF